MYTLVFILTLIIVSMVLVLDSFLNRESIIYRARSMMGIAGEYDYPMYKKPKRVLPEQQLQRFDERAFKTYCYICVPIMAVSFSYLIYLIITYDV